MKNDNAQIAINNAIKSRNVARSIARSEKDNVCDYDILTKHEVRTLLNATSNSDCHTSCLLRLSLFLGRSIDALLDASCEFIMPNANHAFGGYSFLAVRRDYPHLHLESLSMEDLNNLGYVPIPKELTNCFSDLKANELTEQGTMELIESAKALVRAVNMKHNSRLTLGRITRYFRFYCTHNNKSEVRYGVIAGKEMQHHAGTYYTALQSAQVVELQQSYADFLNDDNDRSLFTLPTSNNQRYWGSLRLAKPEDVTSYFAKLKTQCKATAHRHNIIASANNYLAYTLAILQLSTGHRPENEAFGTIDMFNLEVGQVFIDDKESGSNHRRIVTLCDTAFAQLRYYIEHLKALRRLSKGVYPHIFEGVQEILNGQAPLLSYIKDEHFQHDTPLFEPAEIAKHEAPGVKNYYRHLIRTHLEKVDFPSDLIDCFLGHESKRDHSWARYSALSMKHSKDLSHEVESMLKSLKISPHKSALEEW
ncbi:hypothetical protein [Pseudoalteromonas ruthenica]|uniref:hypothetical protein n=1 Tax=Pseudoalteromonas ruthenica TaxID=151081 RepID=UPI00241EB9DE|nr:hypothetical protein [Pseudoalteromonas ruthenica]|tara:strand:+ start:18266 stop:19699 length:1434 start_codon:yes stop_codon:yes gene_type:complete